MANGENSYILSVPYLSALTDRDFLKWCFPFRHYTLSARIADNERPVHGIELGGVHKVTQFAFIYRRADNHIGNATHIGDVVSAMVGRAVFTNQTGAVEHHYYRQLLNSYIMYYLIVGTLHK